MGNGGTPSKVKEATQLLREQDHCPLSQRTLEAQLQGVSRQEHVQVLDELSEDVRVRVF